MGFRFRKSQKIGPFRVTASKSGVSYSVGGKGWRLTRQANGKSRATVSLPGTGISYSETLGGQKAVPIQDRPDSPKSWVTTLILCLLLGPVGGHRFYAGKIGTGVLYLLTLGICGFGWVVDFVLVLIGRFTDGNGAVIRYRPAKQKIPRYLPGDDALLPQSREEAAVVAPQWLKIAIESSNICNATVKPDVFFSRYDLMLQNLRRLAAVEHLLSVSGEKPSAALERLRQERPSDVQQMVQRSYDRMIQEARALKTKQGQDRRLMSYFDTMEGYAEQLGPDGMAYLQQLKERHIVRDTP